MFYSIKTGLIGLCFLILSISAYSQEGQKFAIANVDSVVASLSEFKAAQKELESYAGEINQQLQGMQKRMQEKYNELLQNQNTWTKEKLDIAQKELQEAQSSYANFENTSGKNYNKKQQDLLTPIYNKVSEAIKAMAKDKSYTYVLPSNMFIFSAKADDLTNDLISKLSK